MSELEMTNGTRTTSRHRLPLVVGAGALALALALAAAQCGDDGSGAESATTASSPAVGVTAPTSTIPGATTIPAAPTIPGATTIPRVTVPRATTPSSPVPAATVPAATTIPVPVTSPDTNGPSVTVTFDRGYIYDGTLTCPDQSVDFTVTVSDPSPPVTITLVRYALTSGGGDATAVSLGGNRYRIPRQNFAPPGAFSQFGVAVDATDGLGNPSNSTGFYINYNHGEFGVGQCTP